METYLQPVEDGLCMRPSGDWVAEKLDYLQRYIDVFETSMHEKRWRSRNYIDLFAGPGKCYVESTGAVYLGSPLLALITPHPFTNYYFVELDGERMGALEKRCSAFLNRDSIQFYRTDANIAVRNIVERIQSDDRRYIKDAWPSLNLAFLDPEGLELWWSTVGSLATVNRMDLIIHYPQGGLSRYIPSAYKESGETAVDRFFGGTKWRDIYAASLRASGRVPHRELIHHYRSNLQTLGYQNVVLDSETGSEPLIRNSRRRAPLYRLIFASKHQLGHDFWREVTKRDVYGQGRLI
jgi:three-Cys-motif partner protein